MTSLLHSHQNVSTSFNSAEYKSKIANQNINNTNLQNIRRKNINKFIFALLNINSIRNKFDFVIKDISNNVDFLMISETRTDGSFPKGQFQIKGFSDPFRVDRNTHGGGILFYAREDIPVKLLSVENLPAECFFIEINLRKRKWLVCCSYNPHRDNIKEHLNTISANLDLYSSKYEYIIVIGDFNAEVNDKFMRNFCESYNLSSLIKESTCYKNPENPSSIDLILTNSSHSFQCSSVVETGLSDFRKMIVTVMKTTFQRIPAKIRNYRDYRHFDINIFRESILYELAKESVSYTDLNKFIEICLKTLKNYAPSKKEYNRGNQMAFMNKDLSKAIMDRTIFRNKFLKNRNDENRKKYSKQRNYCVSLLRKTKKQYYGDLNEKNVLDNKKFWKTVKPFLSDKCPLNEKIIIVENDEIISNDKEVAEVLNTNIVSNLNIPEYPVNDPFIDNINDPILKAIFKCKNHPSIKGIEKVSKLDKLFNFNKVDKEEVFKEIIGLDASKASQDTDVPTKIIKETADLFTYFVLPSVNASFDNDDFPKFLKNANIIPTFKKGSKNLKDNYRPISILKNISKVYERTMFKQIV